MFKCGMWMTQNKNIRSDCVWGHKVEKKRKNYRKQWHIDEIPECFQHLT